MFGISRVTQSVRALAEPTPAPTSGPQRWARLGLGVMMSFAGTSHLTFAREDFQAQVPDWFPSTRTPSSWLPVSWRSRSALHC